MNAGYRSAFNEDRPPLARIKALALRAKRRADACRTTGKWLTLQIEDLRRTGEAAQELSANINQRIRFLEWELDNQRAKGSVA